MEMIRVRSSAIAAIGYDARTNTLFVIFTSGPKTYSYFGVPQSVYEGFINSNSHGEYFDLYIRDRYHG